MWIQDKRYKKFFQITTKMGDLVTLGLGNGSKNLVGKIVDIF